VVGGREVRVRGRGADTLWGKDVGCGGLLLRGEGGGLLLTDKRRIPLQSASVRTYTFFTTGFPRFLSLRGARGLQAFDLPLHTSYTNPNYD
jgi:hypothetical protein